jgi:hypothetical protein
MEQVVERFPQVLGSYSIENMKEHVEFLLNEVGISEAKLGKVRFCFLFSYAFCVILQASSVPRGVNDRQLVGMDANVRSPPNSWMRY